MGARRKLSPFVWALSLRTWDLSSSGFGCEPDVVAATRDLAGDGQPGAAAAAAFEGALVEPVVGAALAVPVVGCLDQRPPEVPRSLLGEPTAAPALGRLDHARVEAAGADELPRPLEAARLTDLGQQVAGED